MYVTYTYTINTRKHKFFNNTHRVVRLSTFLKNLKVRSYSRNFQNEVFIHVYTYTRLYTHTGIYIYICIYIFTCTHVHFLNGHLREYCIERAKCHLIRFYELCKFFFTRPVLLGPFYTVLCVKVRSRTPFTKCTCVHVCIYIHANTHLLGPFDTVYSVSQKRIITR